MATAKKDQPIATSDVSDLNPTIGVASAPEQPTEAAAEPVAPFLSEGVRQDLEITGRVVDPFTGGKFERDKETGKVTHTDRAGNVTEV